jgi:hypothetical protein
MNDTRTTMETELYDSGASRHMSPYREKFISYHPMKEQRAGRALGDRGLGSRYCHATCCSVGVRSRSAENVRALVGSERVWVESERLRRNGKRVSPRSICRSKDWSCASMVRLWSHRHEHVQRSYTGMKDTITVPPEWASYGVRERIG